MRRRDMLAGAGAGLATGSVHAAAPPQPPRAFTAGPLATNALAQNFAAPPPGLKLPDDIVLVDEAGRPRRFSDLRGRPALVSLWAEWCAPCLAEAHDLATLAAHAPAGVKVLAVLTASGAKLDGPAARGRLDHVHAEALPTWIEPNGGGGAMKALAGGALNRGGSLPCTLVVDGAGRVRGRMLGARFPTVAFAKGELGPGGKLTEAAKRRLAEAPSIFAIASGPAFLQLLADGALERTPA